MIFSQRVESESKKNLTDDVCIDLAKIKKSSLAPLLTLHTNKKVKIKAKMIC